MSKPEERVPPITKELVEFLDKKVPPKDHKPGENIEDVMFHAGKRALINYLRSFL